MKVTENQQQQPVSLSLHHLAFLPPPPSIFHLPHNNLSRLSYSVAGDVIG
jgi:hypothetical protein